jgi:hypothetical protein
MKKFVYTDHLTEEMVFECLASSILEADKLYKEETEQDVSKQCHVGCCFCEIG